MCVCVCVCVGGGGLELVKIKRLQGIKKSNKKAVLSFYYVGHDSDIVEEEEMIPKHMRRGGLGVLLLC